MAAEGAGAERPTIRLRSAEGEEVEVAEEVAFVSQKIKLLFDHGEVGSRCILLPGISSRTLRKVVDFSVKLVESRAALAAAADDDEGDENPTAGWGKELVRVDPGSLAKLMLAADSLQMPELLHVACEYAAKIMTGKNPEDVKKMFNLKCDVTPEEELLIRTEHAWAFE